MSEKLLEIALAYVSDLADKADCQDAVNEIRSLAIDNPSGYAEGEFNDQVNSICDELEKQIEADSNDSESEEEKVPAVGSPEFLKKMIKLWKSYIEENKCAIMEAEIDEDDVSVKEYQKENKQYRNNIAKYEAKLAAIVA